LFIAGKIPERPEPEQVKIDAPLLRIVKICYDTASAEGGSGNLTEVLLKCLVYKCLSIIKKCPFRRTQWPQTGCVAKTSMLAFADVLNLAIATQYIKCTH
jgi:hypothetical protein